MWNVSPGRRLWRWPERIVVRRLRAPLGDLTTELALDGSRWRGRVDIGRLDLRPVLNAGGSGGGDGELPDFLVQVTAPRDSKQNPETWHYWVIDGVTSPHSNSYGHAERLVSTALSRELDPFGSGATLKGCGVIMDATSISRETFARTAPTVGLRLATANLASRITDQA